MMTSAIGPLCLRQVT